MKRQEEKNKQNYADFRIIVESLLINQGERKLENNISIISMVQEDQEPGQKLLFQKKDNELSGNRQAVEPKKQENVDRTLTETINDV